MTGARDSAIAWRFACFEGWETSTMIPHLFISMITCRPISLRPLCIHWPSRSPVLESANWLWPLWASDM